LAQLRFRRSNGTCAESVEVYFVRCPSSGVPEAPLKTNRSAAVLLQIALLSVTKRQTNAEGHKSDWGNYKYEDASADGLLSVLGGRGGGTAAHGATLAERGRRPQEAR